MTTRYTVAEHGAISCDSTYMFKDIVRARSLAVGILRSQYKGKSANLLIYEIRTPADRYNRYMFEFQARCVGHVMSHPDNRYTYSGEDSSGKNRTWEVDERGKLIRRL